MRAAYLGLDRTDSPIKSGLRHRSKIDADPRRIMVALAPELTQQWTMVPEKPAARNGAISCARAEFIGHDVPTLGSEETGVLPEVDRTTAAHRGIANVASAPPSFRSNTLGHSRQAGIREAPFIP